MEMEFKDTGRRRRFLLVMVGAVLAAGAGLGAFTLASKGTAPPETPKKTVLVAARDIPARTTVTNDDVTMRDVPVDEALSQSYDAQTDVVGRVTSVPIYSDQQITPNLFASASADSDFSILNADEQVTDTSPYWRAVAIKIPADRAVGGEVKAGQHVDIVVSVEIKLINVTPDGKPAECATDPTSQFTCGKSTKISFQDIEVLKAMPDDDMYVFKMNLQQSEQVAHIIQEGPDSFSMVLRPDDDTRSVDTSQYGTTNDRLIMTYLYPAPQWIDVTKLGNPPVPYGTPTPGSVPGGGGPISSPAPSTSPEPGQSPAPGESPAPVESPAASPEASVAP